MLDPLMMTETLGDMSIKPANGIVGQHGRSSSYNPEAYEEYFSHTSPNPLVYKKQSPTGKYTTTTPKETNLIGNTQVLPMDIPRNNSPSNGGQTINNNYNIVNHITEITYLNNQIKRNNKANHNYKEQKLDAEVIQNLVNIYIYIYIDAPWIFVG